MTPPHIRKSQGDLNSEGNKAPLMDSRGKEQRVRQTEKKGKNKCQSREPVMSESRNANHEGGKRGEAEEWAEREKSGWKDQGRE